MNFENSWAKIDKVLIIPYHFFPDLFHSPWKRGIFHWASSPEHVHLCSHIHDRYQHFLNLPDLFLSRRELRGHHNQRGKVLRSLLRAAKVRPSAGAPALFHVVAHVRSGVCREYVCSSHNCHVRLEPWASSSLQRNHSNRLVRLHIHRQLLPSFHWLETDR